MLAALVACPACRGRLREEAGRLQCVDCERSYLDDGGPRLIAEDLRTGAKWHEWHEKQALGLEEYEREGDDRASVEVARAFATFSGLSGTVLDVGCGIGERPVYATFDGQYVGLDPLPGNGQRAFPFVQGLAEKLPFRDECFDGVVSATVLDHLVDPAASLVESRRVLKRDGKLALWIGVADPTAVNEVLERAHAAPRSTRDRIRRRLRSDGLRGVLAAAWRRAASRLRLVALRRSSAGEPQGFLQRVFAERARYHFHFYLRDEVLELVRAAGFEVVETQTLPTDDGTASLFLLARPVMD